MTRRFLGVMLAAALVAVVFAGCSGDSDPTGPQAQPTVGGGASGAGSSGGSSGGSTGGSSGGSTAGTTGGATGGSTGGTALTGTVTVCGTNLLGQQQCANGGIGANGAFSVNLPSLLNANVTVSANTNQGSAGGAVSCLLVVGVQISGVVQTSGGGVNIANLVCVSL